MLPEITPYVTPYAKPTNPGVMNAPVLATFGPRRTVDQVKGLEGANAYALGPDSSVIVVDSDQPLIWFISTDANGNKTMIQPYRIEKYDMPKPVTLDDLLAEMRSMNERLMRVEGGVKHEPDPGNAV